MPLLQTFIAHRREVKISSFNHAASGKKNNAENILVIRDPLALASACLKEFERLWVEGKRLEAAYRSQADRSLNYGFLPGRLRTKSGVFICSQHI
ncbi:hypothetical protein ACMGOD_005691 [Klebsiella oxytoca]